MGSEYLRDQLYSGDWSPLSHRGIAEFILQSYGYTAYARYKGKPPARSGPTFRATAEFTGLAPGNQLVSAGHLSENVFVR